MLRTRLSTTMGVVALALGVPALTGCSGGHSPPGSIAGASSQDSATVPSGFALTPAAFAQEQECAHVCRQRRWWAYLLAGLPMTLTRLSKEQI